MWEESYSHVGEIDMGTFMAYSETRLIGYFRWLQKAGKPEFLGITRILRDDREDYIPGFNNLLANTEELQKSQSVVFEIETIGKLLSNFPDFQKNEEGAIEIKKYSVPCAMAILSLRAICKQYCSECPHKSSNCTGHCNVNTEDILFPPNSAIRLT